MKNLALRLCLALAVAIPPWASAQQLEQANGVFVIAKPSLEDPNFARTVVLVTQTTEASTVGVILNRPTQVPLRELLPGVESSSNYREPVFFGGPVMPQVVVALFRSAEPPTASAFHVLRDLYLTMHPENIAQLLAKPGRQFRLYAGFSAWAPRQLEGEFERDGWYILPADAAAVFRSDIENLWPELVRKAEMRPACLGSCGGSQK